MLTLSSWIQCEGNQQEWRTSISDIEADTSQWQDDYSNILTNATAFALDQAQTGKKVVQDLPFHTSEAEFHIAYRSIKATDYATSHITAVMSYVILIVVFTFMAFASVRHFWYARRSRRALHLSSRQSTPVWSVYLRRWLTLPPLFKQHHSHKPGVFPFTVTIPTRFESLCIVVYLLCNALGCGLGIDVFSSVRYAFVAFLSWAESLFQNLDYPSPSAPSPDFFTF